jgi:hypothetical protein
MMVNNDYHLVMTNIANWKIPEINGGLSGKIIYFYGPCSMAMLNNYMVGMLRKIKAC